MFHKKSFLKIFASALFISLTCIQVYAASGKIATLKLDFSRTEEILQQASEASDQPQKVSMSGTIIYSQNPYVFVFQIKSPVVQTLYVNKENAYILDGTNIYDASDNADFLNQTCTDFLNWFKQDYGLSSSYFKPADRWLEDNQIVSQWDCYNFENQPLDKVLVWSDSKGRFTKLKMYVNSETLVTQTELSAFEATAGNSYPCSINSISYSEDGTPFIKMQLNFKNVHFVLSGDDYKILEQLTAKTEQYSADYPKTDLTIHQEIQGLSIPQEASYRTSLASIVVGTSFTFYKSFITNQDMSNCPFYPSCSQFMLEAVSKNGIFGFFQGLERLKRCTTTEHKRDQYPTLANGKHYDPVPVKEKN